MAKKIKTFEEKLLLLESTIEEMNANSLPLQDLIKKHEDAQNLLKELETELELAKQKFFIVNEKGELEQQNADI